MKKLALFIIATAFLSACCKDKTNDSQTSSNVAIDNIMTRTSIRAYTNEPITDAEIETMLRAGMAAPSAVNKQPWAFVVVRDRATLDTIASINRNAHMAAQAPLAIVVCGDLTKALDGTAQEFWIQDASAATENILLAANALGLGAVWTGFYPNTERVNALQSQLCMPDSIVPLCVIPIGHPAENPQPKDKWKTDNIHYDKW